MPNHDYSIINTWYIRLIITELFILTHSRSRFFISLQFFSQSKFEFSPYNTSILLHNLVHWVSFSRDQALIWRIPSRIKQVELMNMNMEVWISARSRIIQELIRVQSFITRFIEEIWILLRPQIHWIDSLFFKEVRNRISPFAILLTCLDRPCCTENSDVNFIENGWILSELWWIQLWCMNLFSFDSRWLWSLC